VITAHKTVHKHWLSELSIWCKNNTVDKYYWQ